MDDRELLELAAKAAGLKITFYPDGLCRDVTGFDPMRNVFAAKPWNPLTDDGDRYRLARILEGNLYFSGRRGCFEVPSDGDEPSIVEYFDVGDEKAEAYAVVRAAAEIGRNK